MFIAPKPYDALICNELYTLYDSGSDPSSLCPASISFSLLFPHNFQHGDNTYALPPSYKVDLPGPPAGQYVECCYTLTVSTSRARHSRAAFLGQKNR